MAETKYNWQRAKNEYITTSISLRALAKKRKIPLNSLRQKSKAEGWVAARKEFNAKAEAKVMEKASDLIAQHEVNRITRILALSDKLTDKLELAIDQLDIYLAKDKTKIKEVTFENGNLTGEIIKETEAITEVHTAIDRQGLLQVANALKAIKEINITLTPLNDDEEVEDDGLLEALDKQIEDLYEMDDDSSLLPLEDAEQ